MALNARILLVEDDPALRTALAEILEERGYLVDLAGDGRQALDTLDRTPTPSAILLDLAMPVMDGWAFRREQQRNPRLAPIPTILLSASLHAEGQRFEGPRPIAAFAKPFDLGKLLDALRRACEPTRPSGLGAGAGTAQPLH